MCYTHQCSAYGESLTPSHRILTFHTSCKMSCKALFCTSRASRHWSYLSHTHDHFHSSITASIAKPREMNGNAPARWANTVECDNTGHVMVGGALVIAFQLDCHMQLPAIFPSQACKDLSKPGSIPTTAIWRSVASHDHGATKIW